MGIGKRKDRKWSVIHGIIEERYMLEDEVLEVHKLVRVEDHVTCSERIVLGPSPKNLHSVQ